MKKTILRVIALCMVMLVLLTGCEPLLPQLGWYQTVAFSDMEYTRQDVTILEAKQQAVLDSIAAEESVEKLMEKVFAFYEDYHHYYTAYALANIYYCKDITDPYWAEEYNYCLETGSQVDAMLDQMLYALADYPDRAGLEADQYFGKGFFDNYEGESLWDETFTALSEQEAALLAQYYEINARAADLTYGTEEYFTTCGDDLADVYVELVKVRQEMAAYAGYKDYASFAYDFYYSRDYTPAQAEMLLSDIQAYLVPLYQNLDYALLQEEYGKTSSQFQTFNYVKSCAQNMGGTVDAAFQLMETAGLYDISFGENKYDASFEIFISDYYEPYVFVNPTGYIRDRLTFTHEFGHFANDYAAYGSAAGIDVAEFFSQGMEYLSLSYADGGSELTKLKMVDSLCLYVEQATYASFEQEVYSLDAKDLTKEKVYKLYQALGAAAGFGEDWDGRNFVAVPHFFISPMYIISYVVSNDVAMQLYQLEQSEKGAGLKRYVENLGTMEGQFLAFVTAAGLESPFAAGRILAVKETFVRILQ